jgi:hypothetical protein
MVGVPDLRNTRKIHAELRQDRSPDGADEVAVSIGLVEFPIARFGYPPLEQDDRPFDDFVRI